MIQRLMAASLLAFAIAMPVQNAAAQDALGGAIIGGAAGGLLGGALGGRGGVVPGIIIGAAAGAIIASEGERRRGGYYYHRNGCYLQRADGTYVTVSSRYCDAPGDSGAAAPSDAVANCAQRYRSYDPVSQTFVGYDGIRRSCP